MTTNPHRYRHRSEEIEAIQWTGTNADELRAFCGPDFEEIDPEDRTENPDASAAVRESKHGTWRGLEPGYWVVKIGEEFYEESPADFAAQFEPVPAVEPDDTELTESAIDRMMAAGVPVQIVTAPPDTYGAVPAVRPELRDQIAEALEQADYRPDMRRGDLADAIMPVLRRLTLRELELLHRPNTTPSRPVPSRTPAEEAYRLALSQALRLGTGATWEAIRDRAEDLVAEVGQLTEASRRLLEQRQEMAEERFAWQERGDKAETRVRQMEADVPANRAAVLREEAARIRAHCPDHPDSESAEGSWMACHCAVADDMERRVAVEAQQQAAPSQQGPEYTPCLCGHIEPEHEANMGACWTCDCETYRPCTCGAAGDAFVPLGHYADCPQYQPAVVAAVAGEEPTDETQSVQECICTPDACPPLCPCHADEAPVSQPGKEN
ncbi:hypothetical protein ACGFY9_14055 [Streptomyces sp. NPDC048504]|uniref:hypothetical protein n=1 Tax=Streptomyces sp. NPDC048504 TaxID=3365559 RepID=UPI0037244A90